MNYSSTLESVYTHSSLKSEELKLIIQAHSKVTFKKGEFILNRNETANAYYCLESGLVRSFTFNSQGDEITTEFFGRNEIIIEVASLFLRIPTKENIQALSDCECWKLDFNTFQNLYQSLPGYTEWGRLWMSNALFYTKQRSLSMITNSATERYLDLQQKHPELFTTVPLKFIASYLGITDTSLSRIRKEISKK